MPLARARRSRIALAAAACLALTACAEQPATSQAQDVHTLYYVILTLAAVVFLGVEGTLIWSIVRFRRRAGDDAEPPQREGSTRAIVTFFLIGAVIVAVLFPFGEITLARVQQNPTPIEEVDIQGSQWQWSAFYPNEGIVTAGKSFVRPLVIDLPVDEPALFKLVSTDVMHEFFVPQFFFMRNAFPGVKNHFTWTPTKIGTFKGQCAEFCGLGHAKMTLVVNVVSQDDFLFWVKQARRAILSINCPQAPGARLLLTAKNISWSTNCLHVPPGQTVSITVKNLDAGINHNFAIYNGVDQKHQFFETGKFAGVATRTDALPSLPPGRYYFQCNVHGPAMSGVFIVGTGKTRG